MNENNNKFYYSTDNGRNYEFVALPVGSYEMADIDSILNEEFRVKRAGIDIKCDKSTMKCTIITNAIISQETIVSVQF